MKIIKERQRVTTSSYGLHFSDLTVAGNPGFSFDCDEKGNVFPFANAIIAENYRKCMNGEFPDLTNCGVVSYQSKYTENAVGICPNCGEKIELRDEFCGASSCTCGQWYLLNGDPINPPSMWEEPIDSE